jgi:hypothetical protein
MRRFAIVIADETKLRDFVERLHFADDQAVAGAELPIDGETSIRKLTTPRVCSTGTTIGGASRLAPPSHSEAT